jgi:tetratricopeptide (TPR) repeat protein
MAPFWDARSALTEAREALGRALDAPGGHEVLTAVARNWAAYFAGLQGDFEVARDLASAALAVFEARAIDQGRGYALLVLGAVALEQGRAAEAVERYEASLAALRSAGDDWGALRPLNNLGEAARAAGDLARARACHEEALRLAGPAGDRIGVLMMEVGLGHVQRLEDDAAGAADSAARALALGGTVDNGVGLAAALELQALVAHDAGDDEGAARQWGQASVHRRRTGTVIEARDRADHDAAVAAARAALGEERFAALFASGAADVP